MSERNVTLREPQFCDLCGRRIQVGETCRMISDDFMPGFRFFEHLRCPAETPPKNPATGRPASPKHPQPQQKEQRPCRH
jgi:hypothetical protein